MQRAAIIVLATLLGGTAAADSSFVELADCALHPVGTEGGCAPSQMIAALDGLEPEWGIRVGNSADTDAYAVFSVLGALQHGFGLWASGNCQEAALAALEADEIWTWWVKLGPDANEQGAIDFAAIENFTTNAIGFLSEPPQGSCP